MSNNTPVTFTTDEQIQLGQLQENSRIFKNLLILLESNSYKGSDAQAVVESLNVVKSLYNQAQQSIAQLSASAEKRAKTPALVTENNSETTKKDSAAA